MFLYKVFPLRTPFTMIVYFDQSRVDSCLNAKPITVFEPANCNTRRLGTEIIYIFFGRYWRDLIRPLGVPRGPAHLKWLCNTICLSRTLQQVTFPDNVPYVVLTLHFRILNSLNCTKVRIMINLWD